MDKLGGGDPRRIGAYRLLARLGAGGMGQVYLARSDRGRTVAVKLVREELARQEEFRARFRQEVRAARQVGGDWTAPVLDADTEAPVPWVATGYVAGPSLQQVVGHDHGALPERSVRILAAGLAHALKDIHAAGIVHRDLKPSNVLVTIDGPRVIDFGIARALETVTDGGLTRTGALVGSPGFMAPEQVRGDRITPACDVFCLGSVLAYAATGALPFGTANSGVHALMFRIAQEEPDLERVPEGLADLVRDCLRKDPAARPTLDRVLERTGAEDTVVDGRSRDPWLPSALVAQLGRHAVRLLDAEDPEAPETSDQSPAPAGRGPASAPPPWPPVAQPGVPGAAASGGPRPGAPGPASPGTAQAGVPGGVVPAAPGPGVPGAADPAAAAAGSATPTAPRARHPGAPGAAAPAAGHQAPPAPQHGAPPGPGQPVPSGPDAPVPTQPQAPAPGQPQAPTPGSGQPQVSAPGVGQPHASAPAPGSGQPQASASAPGQPQAPTPGSGQPQVSAPGVGQPQASAPAPGSGQLQASAPAPGQPLTSFGGRVDAPRSGHPDALGPGAGPQGPPGPGGSAGADGRAASAAGPPGTTPEHARAADDSAAPPPPGQPGVNHLPTLVAGRNTPAPPPGPAPGGAYGHAQQHPQPPAYGYPYDGHGAGRTPPYGPPPFGQAPPPYGPVSEPRRDGRSTAFLVVIALVVALAAGGSVYALMSGGDGEHRAGGDPSASSSPSGTSRSTGPGTPGTDPPSGPQQPSTSAPADGTIPAEFLGNWSTTIDNATGQHSRRLTVQQGEVGDTVMSLVADGPTGSGTYHCVFEARLTATSGGRLDLGPSSVTDGRPRSACTPGSASEIALLPDGSLRRVNTGNGEQLTYTRD